MVKFFYNLGMGKVFLIIIRNSELVKNMTDKTTSKKKNYIKNICVMKSIIGKKSQKAENKQNKRQWGVGDALY